VKLSSAAMAEACGKDPVLIRSGGSIAALAGFSQRSIPAVLSGFTLTEDALHAPNESYRLESLALGERSARAIYQRLAELKPSQ
jgi:acetylornithine deacetylase/succinyl-diaminopimelate desuccinylase-like protein